jgi:predicted DNA binding CopG/RHH family protein
MRTHYDFSQAKKNPYAKRLKKQVTLRIEEDTLTWFKRLAEKTEIPYQTLINMYLKDCVAHRKQLRLEWRPAPAR